MFKTIKNLFKSKDNFIVPKDRHNEQKVCLDELIIQGEKEANRHNFDEALKCFDKAISIDPTYDYSYGDKALILDKIGRIDESLAMYSKALELNPKNSITWYNKGLTYLNLKKLDEAIKCFDSAVSNNESYAKAWYSKGRCYDLQGNTEKAQFCLNKAKKIDPLLFIRIKKVPIK
ncbi:MAG: tetratricopeptide repeat protein [Nitrosopumilus sp.]|nr:tetratricopeptide repeat protein [Nitrosopumilus sp.]